MSIGEARSVVARLDAAYASSLFPAKPNIYEAARCPIAFEYLLVGLPRIALARDLIFDLTLPLPGLTYQFPSSLLGRGIRFIGSEATLRDFIRHMDEKMLRVMGVPLRSGSAYPYRLGAFVESRAGTVDFLYAAWKRGELEVDFPRTRNNL